MVTDHPVFYDASYVSVVNSYALKMSGITRIRRILRWAKSGGKRTASRTAF